MSVQRVLIVDDEDSIRMVAEICLGQVGGFDTVVASSGQECLDLAVSARPDLIVLDMMMPEMDGLETLRRLRSDAMTQDIPVIFMTARVQRQEIDDYIRAGALGVITKPFDPAQLHHQVRALADAIPEA